MQQMVAAASKANGDLPDGCSLKASLEAIIERGSRKVEVVLLGNGNVGKSSIANDLLGKRAFWPVSKARMTGRLCKTHYGEHDEYSLNGEDRRPAETGKISKNLVQSRTALRNDREQFCAELRVPLQAWTPSAFLRPGVVLVDPPGLDQEKEYMDALHEHIQTTCADQVVILYIMDVCQGMRNSDRQFLEELKRSQWTSASLRLLLVLNKCDTLVSTEDAAEEGSDEASVDYDDLVADIVTEAKNYCQPRAYRLSVDDQRRGGTRAMQEWSSLLSAVESAIAQQKYVQLQLCLHDAHHVMTSLEAVLDLAPRLDKMKTAVREKYAELDTIIAGRAKFMSERSEEIRLELERNRSSHLGALQRREVAHENKRILERQAAEVEAEITAIAASMVRNDIQGSARVSSAHSRLHCGSKLADIVNYFFDEVSDVVYRLCGKTDWIFILKQVFFPHAMVDRPYKERVFSEFCAHCIHHAKVVAEEEFASIVEVALKAIGKDEETIAELEQEKHNFDLSVCGKSLGDVREAVDQSEREPETEEETRVFGQ